jgi:glucose/arabinose dehydrogenase
MRWLRKYREFCDQSAVPLELLGLRSLTKNPFASIFIPGGGETADTGPFQPFAKSDLTRIPATPTKRPNSVVASVALEGGNERIHAYGFRYPRGLAFSPTGKLFFLNDGMEMRGSRPVKDDLDALINIYTTEPAPGRAGGFPDYSASMEEINQPRYQPPMSAFPRNNVPKVGPLLEHGEGSAFQRPDPGEPGGLSRTLTAVFPPLSGASKLAFPPAEGPLAGAFRGDVFVALSGDTAPFGTGGFPLVHPVGYKVVRVNVDSGKVQDFIFNVGMLPGSKIERRGFVGLERPVDVKVGPDGALYVLDMGEIEYKTDGRQKVARAGGKLFKLVPSRTAATQP